MKTRSLTALFLLLLQTAPAAADTLILKTREILRGKLIEKTGETYLFKLDSDGEAVSIPVSKVLIADFDVPAGVPSGTTSFYSTSKQRALPKKESRPENTETVSAPTTSAADGMPIKKYSNVIKNAEQTVALHNARVAQIDQQLAQMKEIAEGAHSGSQEAAAE